MPNLGTYHIWKKNSDFNRRLSFDMWLAGLRTFLKIDDSRHIAGMILTLIIFSISLMSSLPTNKRPFLLVIRLTNIPIKYYLFPQDVARVAADPLSYTPGSCSSCHKMA